MNYIRSYKHELTTVSVQKTTVSPFDTKRYLLNSIDTLAYGHNDITKVVPTPAPAPAPAPAPTPTPTPARQCRWLNIGATTRCTIKMPAKTTEYCALQSWRIKQGNAPPNPCKTCGVGTHRKDKMCTKCIKKDH